MSRLRLPPRAAVCGSLVAVVLLAVSPQGAVAGLIPAGYLTVSDTASPIVISDVAVSAPTLVATGTPESAFVFTEAPGGWGSKTQSAELDDPAGLNDVSVSGDTVVTDENSSGRGEEAVFTEPAGGWTGTVTPSAHLQASDGAPLIRPSVAGNVIAASGYQFDAPHSNGYVFVRPPAGWSGVVHESAVLVDSSGLPLDEVVVSSDGGTIFAEAGSSCCTPEVQRVDVFTEPTQGWSGTLDQTTTMESAGALATAGDLFFDGNVYRRPPGGWQRVAQRPSAYLDPSLSSGSITDAGFDGRTALFATYQLGSEHQCPCSVSSSLISEPSRGWHGVVVGAPGPGLATSNGAFSLALAPGYAFAAAGDNYVDIYRLSGRFGYSALPFQLHDADYRFDGDRLAVGVSIVNPPKSIPAQKVTVSVPTGLRFSADQRTLRRGLTVRGTKYYGVTTPSGQTLVFYLYYTHRTITVGVGYPALRLTPRLATELRRERESKHKVRLTVTIRFAGYFGRTRSARLIVRLP
jgi:hypothetical protein